MTSVHSLSKGDCFISLNFEQLHDDYKVSDDDAEDGDDEWPVDARKLADGEHDGPPAEAHKQGLNSPPLLSPKGSVPLEILAQTV